MQKENIYYKRFTREYAGTHLTKSKYDQYGLPVLLQRLKKQWNWGHVFV